MPVAKARRKSRPRKFLTIRSVSGITGLFVSLSFLVSMRIFVKHGNIMNAGRPLRGLPHGADQHKLAKLTSNILNNHAFRVGSNIIWMYWSQGLDHLLSLSNQTGKYQLDSMCVRGMRHLHSPSKSKWVVKFLNNQNVADYAPTFSSMIKNESLPFISNRLWSDLLRLELLSLYGGIWADTSVCPFVPLDQFIAKHLGPEKDSFFSEKFLHSMSSIEGNSLPKNVSTCQHSKNHAREYRTASTWFMAVASPHNPLIEEWLRILLHHIKTLPDPNNPYFISHCSLTQARMYNATVDNIWSSTLKNRRIFAQKGDRDVICYDSGSLTLGDLKKSCALVKKPISPDITSFILDEYLKYIGGDGT